MKARRHNAGTRNRKKALHHAKCLRDELHSLHEGALKAFDKYRYAIGRVYRLLNRLETEVEYDRRPVNPRVPETE